MSAEEYLFIPRADFLWFFTYFFDERDTRTIELKKRSGRKADTEIEVITLQIRRFYTVEQGAGDIIYTRSFEDGKGEEYTLTNTIGAVALADKLLSDFQDDRVTHKPY